MTVSLRIQRIIREMSTRGATLREIANEAGVSIATAGKYKRDYVGTSRNCSREKTLKIIEALKIGEFTYLELSEKYNLNIVRVRQIFHSYKEEYNFPKAPRSYIDKSRISKINSNNIAEAYALYMQGKTLEDIGNKYGGITRERVRQIFKKAGLRSHSRGEFRKFWHCDKGHPLKVREYKNTCPTCRQELKAFRAKGLHLKTHCKHGHLLTPDNTYIALVGKYKIRRCKKCVKRNQEKYWNKLICAKM